MWNTIEVFYTEAEAVAFIERAEAKGIRTTSWVIDRGLDGRYSVLDISFCFVHLIADFTYSGSLTRVFFGCLVELVGNLQQFGVDRLHITVR